MRTKEMNRKMRVTGLLFMLLMLLSFGTMTALGAQARLNIYTSPSGAGQFRVYVNQKGQKTYLENKGGYYIVNIPDKSSLGMTVFYEVQPNTCFALRGLNSKDIAIKTDERHVQYSTFTLSKDSGQTRNVTAVFAGNHKLTTIPKVPATCEKAGNNQYYRCSVCGKYFSDAAGTKATTPAKMQVKALGHKWDKGTVTKKATRTTTGTIVYKCTRCGAKKTDTIPKLYVDPITATAISPDNPTNFSALEKKILNTKFKKPVKDSTFGLLRFMGKGVKKAQTKLFWKQVPTAKKYVVYRAQAGGKLKKITTTSKRAVTISRQEAGRYYQYIVVAVNGSKAVAVSLPIYVAAGTGKKGNVTSVTASDDLISLSVGGTYTLSAESKKSAGGYKSFRPLRYETSNMDVASVGKNGTVVGLSKGQCFVRVYSQTGTYDEVEVYVN